MLLTKSDWFWNSILKFGGVTSNFCYYSKVATVRREKVSSAGEKTDSEIQFAKAIAVVVHWRASTSRFSEKTDSEIQFAKAIAVVVHWRASTSRFSFFLHCISQIFKVTLKLVIQCTVEVTDCWESWPWYHLVTFGSEGSGAVWVVRAQCIQDDTTQQGKRELSLLGVVTR
jgi:hypothetical protein